MKLTLLIALALLSGCAFLTSPNARYSYQRVVEPRGLLDDLYARGNLKRSRAKFPATK